MTGSNKDDGPKLAPREAEEALKDAAEGLRQVPSASDATEAATLPGIPIEALRFDANAATQRIQTLTPDQTAAASDDSDFDAEAETIPPQSAIPALKTDEDDEEEADSAPKDD